MNVDTLPQNSNDKSLPDCSAQPPATIQKTPHHTAQASSLPLATPSPDNINDNDGNMAPRPEAIAAPRRTVSLSPTEQSSEESDAASDKSLVAMTPAQAKNDADAMDVTEDEQDEDTSQVRRSKREKKSTLVYINGQAVLAKNNYEMKGLSYQYGTDNFETEKPKASKPKKTKPKGPPKQRTVTSQETKRIAHNGAVKARIASKKERRAEFLASNVESLEPFLEQNIASQLKARKTTSSDTPQELFVQPEAIQADMRDYQLEGLNWMVKMHDANLAMILGDEMGLGKTLQTISLLCHLKERDGISGPSLVICPLSVLYSWCDELKRWAPSLKFLRLHSSSAEEREAQKLSFQEKATEFDVVITTYEMAKAQGLRSLWTRQYFNYLILDEGHRIKDATNQISQAVRLIHRENALILTGTPLQNNLIELWSLLNFLYPDVFVTNDRFAEAFNLTENVINKEKLLEAHSLLGLFMLRRLKNEVEKLMPKKVETKVICPLSKTQVFWYKALLMKDIGLLARGENSTNQSASKILSNLVMQLRKCCLHPFLFDGAEVDINSTTCEDLIAASGKLAVLDMLLRSLYEKKHRVVLFSQFTSVLDILDDYCTMRGFKHCRFDGSTARAKRNLIVNQFNAEGSDYFVFLMSTRSGGMGLNLQTADTCILFDSDWNPQPDLQAMARVHRIGQKKTVHVYRLVAGGTIEERMVERAQKKLFLDQMVNQDSIAGIGEDELGGVSKGELLATLKFGCDAVFGGDKENQNKLPTEHDIDVITDRNRSETFSEGKLKGGATDSASEFKADTEFTSTTKLGGIDFKEIRDKHKKGKKDGPNNIGAIADSWIKLQKRNRKSRIVNVEAAGSGYGAKSVPVLAANNYDLEGGETSVFQRELGGRKGNFGEIKRKVKKSGIDFESQDFCQVCGDGGLVLCCPRCPVCVHQECVGIHDPKDLLSCPHHRCSTCNKNVQAAGGLLFPCQSCPFSFCEDCLPKDEKGFRILDSCDRFAALGFHSNLLCYIHCSEKCEEYAKKEFKWEPKGTERPPAPAALDMSHAFGSEIDAIIEEALAGEETCETRLRKRKVMNYKDMDTIDRSMATTTTTKLPLLGPAKKEEDSDFAIDAAADTSDSEDDSETEQKQKVKKVAMPQDPKMYDVVFPCTEHGYLFEIQGRGGEALFSRYLRTPEGTKGPAEVSNKVRGVGDRLMAINRVDVSGYSAKEVIDLLRTTRAANCHVVVSFREADRPLPAAPTQMPKYTAASIRERTSSLDGSVAPATQPTKDRNGRYIRPVGRGRDGMEWDDIRGVWVWDLPKGLSQPKQAKQASVATTHGTTHLKATASLKRKTEDVIDLASSSDHARPAKQAPRVHKPHSAATPALRPLAKGEYEASFPVTKHGLLVEVGIVVDGHTAVFGYRRAPDGSKGPAEIGNLIRGAGDRIMAVNQTDVSGRSYSDVVAFIRSVQPLSSNVILRLLDSSQGGNNKPIAPKVSEKDTITQVVADASKPTSEPAKDEYDAAIPNTPRGLAMRLGNLDGHPVFLEYRRLPDGSKGPAEINKLVRNAGDKIVAVNGVQVSTYHQAIEKIQAGRNNAVTHLRFQVNCLNIDC